MPRVTAAPGLLLGPGAVCLGNVVPRGCAQGCLTVLCSLPQLGWLPLLPWADSRDAVTPHSCNCLCFSLGPLDKYPIKAD